MTQEDTDLVDQMEVTEDPDFDVQTSEDKYEILSGRETLSREIDIILN